MHSSENKRTPWLWITSIYFAEGIPYVVVMTMSVILYKRLGISNTDIALYTSWLYLPWVIKPLWSPLVDIFKTKRQWIIVMQFLIAIALAVVAMAVQTSAFFIFSLSIFCVMAFASSTHDIAADGFYMLGMSPHEQAWWVGIRSTFYRLAMIVGSGLLIMLAGSLESKNGLPTLAIPIHAQNEKAIQPVDSTAVEAQPQKSELRLIAQPTSLMIARGNRERAEVDAKIAQAKSWNKEHSFYAEEKAAVKKVENKSWWTETISKPFGQFLKKTFPKETKQKPAIVGNAGVISFTLSQEPPPGKNIVVNFAREPRGLEYLGIGGSDKGFRLAEGERFIFNSKNWNQPFHAVVQIDPKLKEDTTVVFKTRAGNIPLAWAITFSVLAGLFLFFCIYHKFVLPRPPSDGPVVSGQSLFADFFNTLGSFFKKPGIIPALLFILLYRFAEAQAVKMISPFMLDPREAGGLGLSTGQVGFVYGTVGILALTLGGLFGGFLAAKFGLKFMLPIMVCAIHLPNAAFVFLSFLQPENFMVINASIALEQFGYGFGFTGYMLYLLYFADGPHKTAHYAICTGFMALGMMLPGMFSGWLQEIIGYKHFFVWVMLATIPGFLVAFLVKVDAGFGKKKKE
ncbi:MAG: MFS transporter [Limisphaerales bacterium]